jgi:hypothetical protein
VDKRIEGARPRPRVALIGSFEDKDLNRFTRLFPTIWSAVNFDQLSEQVDPREIDLLVIGADITTVGVRDSKQYNYLNNAHIICFSDSLHSLPGPFSGTYVCHGGLATTEEYELPTVSLPFHRRRELDLRSVSSTKGWARLRLEWLAPTTVDRKKFEAEFEQKAIVFAHQEDAPLAIIYRRDHNNNLGVACLPNNVFSQYEWVELIALEWAESDRESFPGFGDWTKFPEWMLPEEEEISERILTLEEQKLNTIKQIDGKIGRLSQKLAQVRVAANQGRRRLLTAQGDELVEEVRKILSDIGFKVELVDDSLEAGQPKREDLRLRVPGAGNRGWEAIAEVRGYAKSAGTTRDLGRLGRFSDLFVREKGHLPNKRIYIVNGQFEIRNPSQREEPLASAAEDIEEFSKVGGIVISTIDLFRVAKLPKQCDLGRVRDSIVNATGRWEFQPSANYAQKQQPAIKKRRTQPKGP